MRKSCEAAVEGHLIMMKECRPGIQESYLSSKFREHAYSNYNCLLLPYHPIVAAGKNAATLHYVDLDAVIKEDQLVLCDLGTWIQGYASDLTTTFPSNGKFTKPQK